MNEANERTALYRIRGEADLLLYIGISNGLAIRWNGHQSVQPWWDEVRLITVEWYETRTEAEDAEKAAILAEQPKYNVTYLKPGNWRNRERPGVVPVDWQGVTLTPRDDDEDLLAMEGVAAMIAVGTTTAALNALKRTGGPKGFLIANNRVFRQGEIRRWIAAIEASQSESSADRDVA